MKRLIALILSLVLACAFSVTAFAADSPTASEKVTVIIRNAESPEVKQDVEYTIDKGGVITVRAISENGTFDGWKLYNIDGSEAADTDYEIITGSLTSKEAKFKVNASLIICGNYDSVTPAPINQSTGDSSDTSPTTGDMTSAYIAVVMLGIAAFGFGVKRVYSK